MINQLMSDKNYYNISTKGDRRKAFRMPFTVAVVCYVNSSAYGGTMSNLSVNGFFLKGGECGPVGSQCDIEIVLNGDHSCLRIDKLRATVVRSDDGGVGFQFEELLEWIALVPVYSQKMVGRLSSH